MGENVSLDEKCYWKWKEITFEENWIDVEQIYWSNLKIEIIQSIIKEIKLAVKEEITSIIKKSSE